ncbi:hypothetical protein D9M69_584570 [compost metagenome]
MFDLGFRQQIQVLQDLQTVRVQLPGHPQRELGFLEPFGVQERIAHVVVNMGGQGF